MSGSKPKTSLRSLIAAGDVIVTPLAHDALTARMIERAGFPAIGVGGSAMLAARYGLPDIGLAALGEMAAGIADIVAASGLPVMVDGDDGYGDVRAVVRMVEVYARAGVSGIVIEDQMRGLKQPGDAGALAVEDAAVMAAKLRAAIAACSETDIRIIARCDAYQTEGLDGAMRRGDQYLGAGAHGIFFPGLRTRAELGRVGERFRGAHIMAAAFEGRDTWLPIEDFRSLGIGQVVLPGLLITRVVNALDAALADLRRHVDGEAPMPPLAGAAQAQEAFRQAVMFDRWTAIG